MEVGVQEVVEAVEEGEGVVGGAGGWRGQGF